MYMQVQTVCARRLQVSWPVYEAINIMIMLTYTLKCCIQTSCGYCTVCTNKEVNCCEDQSYHNCMLVAQHSPAACVDPFSFSYLELCFPGDICHLLECVSSWDMNDLSFPLGA